MALHGADLTDRPWGLSDPLRDTSLNGKRCSRSFGAGPARGPTNCRLFYALTGLCSVNKTLNSWVIKTVVTCVDFPKKGELR